MQKEPRDPITVKADLIRANKLLKSWRESNSVDRSDKVTFYYLRIEELLEELHPTKVGAPK